VNPFDRVRALVGRHPFLAGIFGACFVGGSYVSVGVLAAVCALVVVVGVGCLVVISRSSATGGGRDRRSADSRAVLLVMMLLGVAGGIYLASRSAGDSQTSAAVQAGIAACLLAGVLVFVVTRWASGRSPGQ
jgi:hypothetical protein